MKKCLLFGMGMLLSLFLSAKYTDHRGVNVDSLERVVAVWTPERMAAASTEQLGQLVKDYRALMRGYNQLNGVKSRYYARKALAISRSRGWDLSTADACRYIGQHFWAAEAYDSAMFYYREALLAIQKMAESDRYSPVEVDDDLSALFGAIGNCYNMMDSIPKAMEYYAEAGKIFDRYGWNESNSTLWYNIGETWVGEKEYKKALSAYERALQYAREAGDSLLYANACKGLGGLYMDTGRTGKALRYLREAEKYYALHDDQEFRSRMENLDFMGQVLEKQRLHLVWGLVLLFVAVLLAGGVLLLLRRLRRSERLQTEAAVVMDETLEDLHRVSTPSVSEAPELSEREKEVLSLLSKGYTAPQIAEALCLSPETIKWYRKKLLVKLDVANTPEMISRAKDWGLV